MQTKITDLQDIELKAYAFSINMFSFVKTLEKAGKADNTTTYLLNLANSFYTNYLAAVDAKSEYERKVFLEESKNIAEECLSVLQSFETENKFLNEKVDLIIEIAELNKNIEINE